MNETVRMYLYWVRVFNTLMPLILSCTVVLQCFLLYTNTQTRQQQLSPHIFRFSGSRVGAHRTDIQHTVVTDQTACFMSINEVQATSYRCRSTSF